MLDTGPAGAGGRTAARRWVIAALLALAALPAGAGCALKSLELPVKMVDARPIAVLGLNGTPVPMLVDTGAFYSLLTEAAAAQLRLTTRALPESMPPIRGITGFLQASRTRVDKVQLPGGTIPDVEFIVGINEVGGGAMGVIGRNFLGHTDIEFDLGHGMVRLFLPEGDCSRTNMAYWAGETPVNAVSLGAGWGDTTPPFVVTVRVNGENMKALLDTGAPESSLSLTAATRAGIQKADMVPGRTVGGAGSGHARSWIARVEAFELGGERIQNNRLDVLDAEGLEQGMTLGVDYFLAHRIYLARAQRRMYATWNGGAVFGRNAAAAQDAAAADAETAPDDADGLARRGAASAARGDFVRALADLDRACALAPKDAGHFATRARIHRAMARDAEALKDLDEALRLDPADAAARMDRADLRIDAADRDGALADLRLLDQALPRQSNLRAAMARAFAALALPDDALPQWDLWLAAHANDAGRDAELNARCWMRVRLNLQLDRALADCREAVQQNPDQSRFRGSLGWTHLRRGELAQAITAFDEAIALQAASPWSFYGRGLARLRQGEKALAAADLAQARALAPEIDAQLRPLGLAAE